MKFKIEKFYIKGTKMKTSLKTLKVLPLIALFFNPNYLFAQEIKYQHNSSNVINIVNSKYITTIDSCPKAEINENELLKQEDLFSKTTSFFGLCSNKVYGTTLAEEWVKLRYGKNAFIEEVKLEKSNLTLDSYIFLIKIPKNNTTSSLNKDFLPSDLKSTFQ